MQQTSSHQDGTRHQFLIRKKSIQISARDRLQLLPILIAEQLIGSLPILFFLSVLICGPPTLLDGCKQNTPKVFSSKSWSILCLLSLLLLLSVSFFNDMGRPVPAIQEQIRMLHMHCTVAVAGSI
ncbi:hypothetical protein BC939DRAFT_155650 [Gamsiella multidivaricata]|uniref:uncharacterized protein n=1 Tax=Gamsiella multidivaricata TaxID=101098 RepID=UPI002220B9AB|nr:uncharacterized protein BC939DRAFT_155650 [Gamsiella multidivaricata]KAI7823800.1 hypothetical protein BC939DRAFT_155650 [Gamsiella multidivaricata]